MYLIVEKGTKTIVHTNMAPLSQKLSGANAYFQFNGTNHDLVLFKNINFFSNKIINIVESKIISK